MSSSSDLLASGIIGAYSAATATGVGARASRQATPAAVSEESRSDIDANIIIVWFTLRIESVAGLR